MIRKYTSAFFLIALLALTSTQSCSRTSKENAWVVSDARNDARDVKAPIAARPAEEDAPAQPPPRATKASSAPVARALSVDKLMGGRPLDRILPEDYTLGPLQDLSIRASGSVYSAAGAIRSFLDGLAEGRLSQVSSGARSILEFLLTDILSGKIRITRWRMGAGTQRPEGGFLFPVLLEAGACRTLGEIVAMFEPGSGWCVELAMLDMDDLRNPRPDRPGAFDPTIRTVKRTGR